MVYRAGACLYFHSTCDLLNNLALLRMLRHVGDSSPLDLPGCRFTSVQTKPMNTTNCAMINALMDDAGMISWEGACRVAASHSLYEDFIDAWWAKCCHNYEAGLSAKKLAYWLGY